MTKRIGVKDVKRRVKMIGVNNERMGVNNEKDVKVKDNLIQGHMYRLSVCSIPHSPLKIFNTHVHMQSKVSAYNQGHHNNVVGEKET